MKFDTQIHYEELENINEGGAQTPSEKETNKMSKYVILSDEMDDQGRISKIHIGTYDYETALYIYTNEKAQGVRVYMQTELEFKINRMHEMAQQLNIWTFA
jgi:hypothetical protein